MQHLISLTVNGEKVMAQVESHRTLVEFLRDQLNLTGPKEGCGDGECGACTVLMDGVPVRACLILAVEAHGPFRLHGEAEILDALDRLLRDFVAQRRMKLSGEYTPCYELVV